MHHYINWWLLFNWLDKLRVEKWESAWSMEFNPSRNVIQITHRHTPFKFQCKLHGKVLETADAKYKCLGIHLSHDLHENVQSRHVNEITTKVSKALDFLHHNLCTCLAKSKEWTYMYKALVRMDLWIQCHCLGCSQYIAIRTYNRSKWFNDKHLIGYLGNNRLGCVNMLSSLN